jgi:uncharacterized RDD family membrane protein YckC
MAVLWAAGLLHTAIVQYFSLIPSRLEFQMYLGLIAGVYFVAQWSRGGQTLPMKTWGLRLQRADGGAVNVSRALLRYLVALIGAALLGIGFLWALVDRDRQFLHDRIAGTRIIRVAR